MQRDQIERLRAENERLRGVTVPGVDGEAQNGLNDTFLGDPYPVSSIIADIRQRHVQALHAGLSRRDWWATETAANALRDSIDRLLIRLEQQRRT
ncbi:hypothetical protein CCR97_08360 [Rhodoplanes elegans]|uniref:Uncharacterized protein n=1 Tax=Rhodoplanes elegans TaxID=29408 RepID=A0A327KPU9_9BRAD|nr:hypothetical protein [Rhodoplanes elegans]MBK5958130.1 hypothetical protein [Rhodoplanes elegans]MBK5958222.1 hypothetical protein [Rhodoplanes elegans]RAI40417.1 hypothetical protein CH338_06135 [Rhodoplanes elegans]